MKLHLDSAGGRNVVTAYGDAYVEISRVRYESSVVVLPDRVVTDWGRAGFDALSRADIEQLLAFQPMIVLLGTGKRQRFPPPALMQPLMDARIGYEIMNLQAACRTYNIVIAEGRHAAAALLFD